MKTITFTPDKVTKNTVRFREDTLNETTAPCIGALYVSKLTLNLIGWNDGKKLTVTLSAD